MKEAIQKAREGGYTLQGKGTGFTVMLSVITNDYIFDHLLGTQVPIERVYLDRDFWYYLGKQQKWQSIDTYRAKWIPWISAWHNFIDHLAEGKDIDSFFNNLLK